MRPGVRKVAGESQLKPDPRYSTWSSKRRIQAAVDRCVWEKWSQTDAARIYGVNRSNLNRRVKAMLESLADAKVRSAERDAAKRRLSIELSETNGVSLAPAPIAPGDDPDEDDSEAGADLRVGNERRRFPTDPLEFDRMYFSHVV
jgi:hypothetical protein